VFFKITEVAFTKVCTTGLSIYTISIFDTTDPKMMEKGTNIAISVRVKEVDIGSIEKGGYADQ
jgi:hypothetical protein